MSDVPASLFVLDLIPTQSLDLSANRQGLEGQNFSQVLEQQVERTDVGNVASLLPVTTIGPLEELVIYEVPLLDPKNPLPLNTKPMVLNPEESEELEALQNKIPFLESSIERPQVIPIPALPGNSVAAELLQTTPIPAPVGLPGGKDLPETRSLLPQSSVNLANHSDRSTATLTSAKVENLSEQPASAIRQDSILENAVPEPPTRQPTLPTTLTTSPSIGELSQTAAPQITTPPSAAAESRGVTATLKAPLLPNVPPQEQQTWQTELSQRILWLTESKTPVATLRLNPPELGLVEIRVSVSQDQAAVSFAASSPEVRSAIEAALPRLHGLFQQNGMDLSHTDVGQHRDSQAQTSAGGDGTDFAEPEAESINSESSVESDLENHQILDVFI